MSLNSFVAYHTHWPDVAQLLRYLPVASKACDAFTGADSPPQVDKVQETSRAHDLERSSQHSATKVDGVIY